MERRTIFGVVYSNEPLHVEENIYPHTFHFVDEGKERKINLNDHEAYVVGRAVESNQKDSKGILVALDGEIYRYSPERVS